VCAFAEKGFLTSIIKMLSHDWMLTFHSFNYEVCTIV